MAEITVTIPDEQAMRIVAAFCADRAVPPETMAEGIAVVQEAVFAHMRDRTLLHEANQARERVLTDAADPLVGAVVTQGEG